MGRRFRRARRRGRGGLPPERGGEGLDELGRRSEPVHRALGERAGEDRVDLLGRPAPRSDRGRHRLVDVRGGLGRLEVRSKGRPPVRSS